MFLFGKNMLIVMVLILINKDVFEPSYNDLKLMVRNYNYFCTNLNIFPLGNTEVQNAMTTNTDLRPLP